MKRAAFSLAILAALALSFAGHELVSTAQAQTARTASCIATMKLVGTSGAEKWMNEQIAAGRADFSEVGGMFCAW